MSGAAWALLVLPLLPAQPVPPELARQQQLVVDPALPESIRGAVQRASQAELDPKRGAGNAVEILKAEKPRYTGDQPMTLALDLRIAAFVLRAKFLGNTAAPESVRYSQALSTYSKLDLTDPGLAAWLDRAVQHVPEAKAQIETPKTRTFRLAVLTQGPALDREAAFTNLKKALAAAGVNVQKAPAEQAEYTVKLVGLETRDDAGKATVRVAMEIAGPASWKTSLFRTTEAKDAKLAVVAAVDWLLRIGGRELLFHWLTEHGLKGAVMSPPAGDPHGHPSPTPGNPSGPPKQTAPGTVHIPKITPQPGADH